MSVNPPQQPVEGACIKEICTIQLEWYARSSSSGKQLGQRQLPLKRRNNNLKIYNCASDHSN